MKLQDCLNIEYKENQVLSFVEEDYHENFGYQWTRFNKLQLDSHNGSGESKERLLIQSEMKSEFFKDKIILEVGAGNGRFTEVLLNLGAKVMAVDYSSAIYANFKNHSESVKKGNLICLRADVFDLPIKESMFDIVICYGVIQHTGNNKLCLDVLADHVRSDGTLMVDIYSNSIKHYNPWIYLIRPFFSRIKGESSKMRFVERFIDLIFPIQLFILNFLHNKGHVFKYIRYFFNRSPNSVYGINLYLDKRISKADAKDWSICDTYDAWMPKHDDPLSLKKWNLLLSDLKSHKGFDLLHSKECGQGNCASLRKK